MIEGSNGESENNEGCTVRTSFRSESKFLTRLLDEGDSALIVLKGQATERKGNSGRCHGRSEGSHSERRGGYVVEREGEDEREHVEDAFGVCATQYI